MYKILQSIIDNYISCSIVYLFLKSLKVSHFIYFEFLCCLLHFYSKWYIKPMQNFAYHLIISICFYWFLFLLISHKVLEKNTELIHTRRYGCDGISWSWVNISWSSILLPLFVLLLLEFILIHFQYLSIFLLTFLLHFYKIFYVRTF